MWKFFLISQNRSTNHRSGMSLEVQIQIFGSRTGTSVKVFIFKIFQGAQMLIFFLWKLAWSLLLHENQTQKYKFEIRLLKIAIFDLRKSVLLDFKETPQNNFSLCFLLSFKNNRHTNVLLVGIFESALKKVIDHQKCHFGGFWWLIKFFYAF